MENIFKLNYVSQQKIWGTEDWLISGHKNGDATITVDGKEYSFSEFYKNNKELFGINDEEFPLLVKIIDAKQDLSIQVHPNDEYAKENENSLGKTECWYILDAPKGTDIIVGINSKNKEELKLAIDDKEMSNVLSYRPIKEGDFLYIPAGCVHAICANTRLLEIQQSSDVTYRLYDYDRPGDDGNLRELHIDQSLDVIDYDYNFEETRKTLENAENIKIENLVTGQYFYVNKYTINGDVDLPIRNKFTMLIALDEMKINGETLQREEAVVVLKDTAISVEGNGSFIVSGV